MSSIFSEEVLDFFEHIINVLGRCKINYVNEEDCKGIEEQYKKAKEIFERWRKQDYK